MVRSVSLVKSSYFGAVSAWCPATAKLSCLPHQRGVPFAAFLLEDIAPDQKVDGHAREIPGANAGGAVRLSENVGADAGGHARHDRNGHKRFGLVRPEVDCLRVYQM